ncbi:MAG: methylenetetrahydrofolate--tRNA-(uracil(54)-C(5))-methyltransferase (FADH(2)-oxidizing) TrmFO [Proteobacteria bacterium]|nr:methylenetetrahydrofolate--tRNA-(uracil(54)-C(5))-methyltransferase (FADH(2)-oxidizing) TrmFO [Pseudomonadota bacterium]
MKIAVIGAGLAGCEAVNLLIKNNFSVDLFEMKPKKLSPAHKLPTFAELVCSNSLKTTRDTHPQGMLKYELLKLNSVILSKAQLAKVPSGDALAVDRVLLSKLVTDEIMKMKNLRIINKEVEELPQGYDYYIIATGPLTSESLSEYLASELLGSESLYFYDAIAPIIDAESIDMSRTFFGSRYDKGGDDYLNIPLTKEEYLKFIDALRSAEKVPLRSFEKPRYYEGCLPVEVLAERGIDTLAYGPMKPVGFDERKIGFKPYAVVQLRREDKEGTAYNLVGFQTKLTIKEQERIFRSLRGLERAVFLRYGSIHRNTFIDAPKHLNITLNLKGRENIYFAGQITGVEGYVESIATGLLSALFLIFRIKNISPVIPSARTALGALLSHTQREITPYQPSGLHLGLFLKEDVPKKLKEERILENERKDFDIFSEEIKNFISF